MRAIRGVSRNPTSIGSDPRGATSPAAHFSAARGTTPSQRSVFPSSERRSRNGERLPENGGSVCRNGGSVSRRALGVPRSSPGASPSCRSVRRPDLRVAVIEDGVSRFPGRRARSSFSGNSSSGGGSSRPDRRSRKLGNASPFYLGVARSAGRRLFRWERSAWREERRARNWERRSPTHCCASPSSPLCQRRSWSHFGQTERRSGQS